MELLIVIGLIGILLAIAAVSYSSAQKKSRDTRRMSDLRGIQNAMEQYYADNSGSYPASTADITGYLPSGWPLDPKTGVIYTPSSMTAGGFCVCAPLEGTVTGGNASDLDCTFTSGAYFCVKNQQ